MLTDSLRLYVISEHCQLESDVGTKDLLTQMPSGSWYEFNLLIAQQTAAKKNKTVMHAMSFWGHFLLIVVMGEARFVTVSVNSLD